MKKYVLLAGLLVGMPACGLFENECGSDTPGTYYDVQGLDVTLAQQVSNGASQPVGGYSTVARYELRLQLQLQERYYTVEVAPRFGSAAYACSPTPAGWLGTSERVDSLAITSTYAYDAAHPAGTSLLDLLEAVNTIDPFRLPSPQDPQEPFRAVEFRLRTPPAAAGPQQFRVYYRQTNGEVYTAETVRITLVQ